MTTGVLGATAAMPAADQAAGVRSGTRERWRMSIEARALVLVTAVLLTFGLAVLYSASALVAISFIVFMLIVVRPVMRNITQGKEAAEADKAKTALADGELSADDMRMIQIGEGESLEEIKAKLKPKKSSISLDMLDTANTYDDKVALIRMLVAEDSGRVANVLKSMVKVN